MTIVCIDTSTREIAAGWFDADGADEAALVQPVRAQQLLELLSELNIVPASIRGVVVGIGPGSFTGLRVGVTSARGIAAALHVPIVAVPSLAIIATPDALEHPNERVWAAIDAGRGECFIQPFVFDTGVLMPLEMPQTCPVGDVALYAAEARRVDARVPTGEGLLAASRLAWASRDVETQSSPDLVVPTYGRAPDAAPPSLVWDFAPLTIADLDDVVALDARCVDHPWTRGMHEAELVRADEESVLLGARARMSGRLVGAVMCARIGDSWHVMNVLVDPVARRRGIGRALVTESMARSAQRGAGLGEGWTLEVRVSNAGAIALYESLGFDASGTRPGYYSDTGEAAVVMWKREGVLQ